jgi:hypothetical protein
MNNQNNPESEGFFDITLKKREDYESFEEVNRKEERRKYNRIMREARKLCPISYEEFVRLLKYKYNINYFGSKNPRNRYVDDLISIGKLTKTDGGTVTLGGT